MVQLNERAVAYQLPPEARGGSPITGTIKIFFKHRPSDLLTKLAWSVQKKNKKKKTGINSLNY